VLLEEYGAPLDGKPLSSPVERARVYESWLRLIEGSGSLGDLLWMLGLPKGAGQPYTPDSYVIADGPELTMIRRHAETLLSRSSVREPLPSRTDI
jgi:hypothetical protein